MEQKKIIVNKTARYFILGEVSEEVEQVWFVCHGYAQLANYFLRHFEVLKNSKTLIVAPEGLHRFYWEGFSGKVVASWMTKEDRDDDIKDYINYLDAVYSEIVSSLKNKRKKINVLGFSQGTATVCRWLSNGKSRADGLVLWAGGFPSDFNFESNKAMLDSLKISLVIGDKDEFISEEQAKEQVEFLEKKELKIEVVKFKGKHEIDQETLKRVAGMS